MTNAEKIKQMDDCELAEIIKCPYGVNEDICNQESGCFICCLKWIRSMAENVE